MVQLQVRRHGRGCGETLCFRALTGPLQRMRGLLGTSADAGQVALVGCAQIHTVGMRYHLDVAFVAQNGTVLEVWRSVPPGRLLGSERASVVLERPHSRRPWLVAGETVEMTMVGRGTRFALKPRKYEMQAT